MRWWLWRSRQRREAELDRELRAHLELETEEQREAGVPPGEARYAAQRAFGNATRVQEAVRETWHWTSLGRFAQDLRYGLRLLARSPGFTAVAVLTLALGIGANTAIFSVINAMLLRLLPVEKPRELVQLRRSFRGQNTPPGGGFSYPAYERFRDNNEVFSGILTASWTPLRAKVGNSEDTAEGQYVSGNFYSLLGVRAILGRTFTEQEDRVSEGGGAAVAVISHGFWQRAYGGDRSVLGRQLLVEEKPFTIIGVTSPGFSGLVPGQPQDFAIPMALEPRLRTKSWLRQPHFNWLAIVGRLKPGTSLRAVDANLNVIFRQHLGEMEAGRSGRQRQSGPEQVISVTGASGGLARFRDQYSRPLYILMAVAGIVLLIACVNLANLLLARAAARRRELGLRLALGAGRARLVAQLMTEALLLAAIGGALGLLFARWTSAFLVTFLKGVRLDVGPDTTILLFTAAVCLLASLIFGLAPAFQATRADPGPAIKEGAVTRGDARSGNRLRGMFIVSQVALSLILVIAAALFVVSLRNLQTLDPGFRREEVLLSGVHPGKAGYRYTRLVTFYEQLLDRVRQIPGVRAASLAYLTPISGAQVDFRASVEGSAREPNSPVYVNCVSDGYFETMGTPILQGRDFNVRDNRPESTPVLLINDSMARYYFAGANPIGRRVTLGGQEPAEIAGVVADARYGSLREPPPRTAYQNCLQGKKPNASLTLAVQAAGPASDMAGALRAAAKAVNDNVPIDRFTPFASQVDDSLLQERLMATLSGLFGGLALLMACIGLYGVLAYSVARRTREIGIRMALGARRSGVASMVLREILAPVAAGVSIGLGVALALGRYVTRLLYGLQPSDPWTLAAAAALLVAVAVIAAYVPARRASRIDPMVALRYE